MSSNIKFEEALLQGREAMGTRSDTGNWYLRRLISANAAATSELARQEEISNLISLAALHNDDMKEKLMFEASKRLGIENM